MLHAMINSSPRGWVLSGTADDASPLTSQLDASCRTARSGSDVTSAVPADARLALDDFRAVGTRNESLASRDSINFLLPGLRCNEDEHAQGPEKRAEHEPAARVATLVLPDRHSDIPGDNGADRSDHGN